MSTIASKATNKPTTKADASSEPSLTMTAVFYMVLLAVQFGIQPILTRRYAPWGVTRSTIVLMQEAVKFVIALFFLQKSGNLQTALKDWSIPSWLTVAFVPAALYSIQNMAALTAYQNLDALTFNVLNQTKTLSAAFCCYLVMGRKQSIIQILALILLLVSALIMEDIIPVAKVLEWSNITASKAQSRELMEDGNNATVPAPGESESQWGTRHFTYGIVPLMIASFISGLAGALTQKNLQATSGARNSYLFSMELCAATSLILFASLVVAPDGKAILEKGFWHQWTPQTWIPIFTNACGGVLVGLVTQYAGSVRKGFALIFGMLLSGVLQAAFEPDAVIRPGQIAGGILAAISLYLHLIYPPVVKRVAAVPKSDKLD